MNMDRNALILYLERLRNLEVIKYRLKQESKFELANLDQQILDAKRPAAQEKFVYQIRNDDDSKANWKAFFITLGLGFIAGWAVGFFVDFNFDYPSWDWASVFVTWAFAVIIAICIVAIPASNWEKEQWQRKETIDQRNQANLADQQRRASAIPELNTKCAARDNYYKGRIAVVDQLLEKYYALNIIPSDYRNLAHIIYIYNFMSTSQFDLDYVLFHTHMEDGIQRIEASINNATERISNEIRALNETTMRGNIAMLNRLDRSDSSLRDIYLTMQSLENEFYYTSRNNF